MDDGTGIVLEFEVDEVGGDVDPVVVGVGVVWS